MSGAPARSSSGASLIRIAVCGQTTAHLPQSMHSDGSQMGISSARARFSHFAVPVGHSPSTGSALTGSSSPSPRSTAAVTRWTNAGAASGRVGMRCTPADAFAADSAARQSTRSRAAMAVSMAAKLRSTTVRPRFP